MKKIYIILSFVFLLFVTCSSNMENTQNAEETLQAVEDLADQYLEAWNNKDLNQLDQMTTSDGQFYGSDPEEIMDKTGLLAMYTSFFADTTTAYLYTVDLRKIKVSSSDKSAMIMERITFPEWSPKMPMCQTFHLVYTDDTWKIDFISWGFIIKNDDVAALNDVL